MMILEDYLDYAMNLFALPWDVVILTYLGYKWIKRRGKTRLLGFKLIGDHIYGKSEKVQLYKKRQKVSEEKAIEDVRRMYTVVRVWIFLLLLKTVTSPFLFFAPIYGYWGEFLNEDYETQLDLGLKITLAKGFSLFPFVWFPIVYGVNQYRMLDEDFPRINQRTKYLNDCKRSDYSDGHSCVLYYQDYQDEDSQYYLDGMNEMIYDKKGRLSLEARCSAASSLSIYLNARDIDRMLLIDKYACYELLCEDSCKTLEFNNVR